MAKEPPSRPEGPSYSWQQRAVESDDGTGPRPSFFVVGNPKAGTTSLFHLLLAHPALHLPVEKELHHFATDLTGLGDPFFPPSTLDAYLACFRGAEPGQVCGEVGPAYVGSQTALANIAAFDADARIVVLFREPVAALRSIHGQLLRAGMEDEADLATALSLEPARRAGHRRPAGSSAIPRHLYYRDRMRYRDQLDRIDSSFGPEQVLVLVFDDLRDDPQGTFDRVCAHIGVRSQVVEAEHANSGVSVASARLTRRVRAPRTPSDHVVSVAARGARTLLPASARRALRERGWHPLHRQLRGVPDALAASLRAEARPDVEALGARVGQDLVRRWGYDR